jgi:hypothetical protein
MAMGTVLMLIVLEGTRRVIGWALPLSAVVFLVYGLFVARLEPMRMLDQLYMTTEGIFGVPLAFGILCNDFRTVWLLHGAHWHGPTVHGLRHGADRPHRWRSWQGIGGELELFWHPFPASPLQTSWSTGRSRSRL